MNAQSPAVFASSRGSIKSRPPRRRAVSSAICSSLSVFLRAEKSGPVITLSRASRCLRRSSSRWFADIAGQPIGGVGTVKSLFQLSLSRLPAILPIQTESQFLSFILLYSAAILQKICRRHRCRLLRHYRLTERTNSPSITAADENENEEKEALVSR